MVRSTEGEGESARIRELPNHAYVSQRFVPALVAVIFHFPRGPFLQPITKLSKKDQ